MRVPLLMALVLSLGLGAEPPIRVGVDADYYPFEFQGADGRAAGFSVELLEAIGQEEGLTFTFHPDLWTGLREKLASGDLEMLSGMFYSATRAQTVAFSRPFLRIDYALFVRRGSEVPRRLDQLGARPVLVQDATLPAEWLQGHTGCGFPVPVPTERQALKWLADGQAAGALVTQVGGLALMREHGLSTLESLPVGLQGLDYCFGVGTGRRDIVPRLDRGLEKVRRSGIYDRLHRKWFGAEGGRELSRSVQGAVLWSGASLLVGGCLVAAWVISLRRQVRVRTEDLILRQAGLEARTRDLEALLALTQAKTRLDPAPPVQDGLLQRRAPIPQCKACRRLRDDQGYWTLAESYVMRTTGTSLSQGLCPDCVQRMMEEQGGGPE